MAKPLLGYWDPVIGPRSWMLQQLEEFQNSCISRGRGRGRGEVMTSSHSTNKIGFISSPTLARGTQRFLESHRPPVHTGSLEILVYYQQGSSSSSRDEVINSAARWKAKQAKPRQTSSWSTLFNLGCYQKRLPITRVGFLASVKAIRAILQARLPTQVILICGKLTLKPPVIMQDHESCRGLISEGSMGHVGAVEGGWMVIR